MAVIRALAWVAGVWLAAGAEAAWSGGMPGPMLLVAVAAGLLVGPAAGMLLGVLAGISEAALFGGSILLQGLLGLGCGGCASLIARWCAPRHLLVAAATAAVLSFPAALLAGWPHYHQPAAVALAALRRSGENALWMVAIYGIVLLLSHRIAPARFGE